MYHGGIMIVNLYVDRMMTTPPQSMYDVYNATKAHAGVYKDAAARIGLTPAEYKEFRKNLLDGKAVYIRLPRHLDSIAGVHHGRAYALSNVHLSGEERGWEVGLANGTQVFVPSTCGNLAMLHKPAPFHAVAAYQVNKPVPVFPQPAPPPVTEVSFAPPAPIDAAPMSVPVSHPVAWWPIPLVGGLAAGLSHIGSGGGTPIPPCSAGSNSMGVCHAGLGADYGN
jgi:hypothetical protein